MRKYLIIIIVILIIGFMIYHLRPKKELVNPFSAITNDPTFDPTALVSNEFCNLPAFINTTLNINCANAIGNCTQGDYLYEIDQMANLQYGEIWNCSKCCSM